MSPTALPHLVGILKKGGIMKKNFWSFTLLAVSILVLAGCPQPVTPKSSIATLSNLSVTAYALDKTFSSDVTTYTVVVDKNAKTVNVNATLTDSKATLAFNPDPATSELLPGLNTFVATVTAEDGTTTKAYTLNVYKANATVEILDSVNGSKVDANGTIAVYTSDHTLLYSISISNNPQPLWLGEGTVYTVKATPTGRAQSSKESVVGADGLNLIMISQRLDQNTFPAESPTIDTIAYTTDGDATEASWTALNAGDPIDFSTVTFIKITASGKSDIDETSWSGFGIRMGIDQVPSIFSGWAPDPDLSSSTYNHDTNTFTGTAIFDTRGSSFTSGDHELSFVIYDRANNRTEKTLKVCNSLAKTDGSDISGGYFVNLLGDFRIYGVTREYFGKSKSTEGLDPLATGSVSYRAALTFKFQTAATDGVDIPILGYKVYRSADAGFNWSRVGTVNYGYLTTGSGGTHTYYDTDSALTTGASYLYKVVAFTDDTHTKESANIGPVWFLPPFTASLTAPDNKSIGISAAEIPTFKFTISDPRLWSQSLSDRYYFSPVIRKADGTYAYVGYFYYRFSDSRLAFEYPGNGNWYLYSAADTADFVSFDPITGEVSLSPDLFSSDTNFATGADMVLESGVTYYWDMFGSYSGSASTNTASYFYKAGTNCTSRSYADVYQNGQQTLNGWFSFTVE